MTINDLAGEPIPIHVGLQSPEHYAELRERVSSFEAEGVDYNRDFFVEPPLVVDLADVDWSRHRVLPRWLGEQTDDAPLALDPGFTHGRGGEERRRLLAGARQRGEPAVIIATVRAPADHRGFSSGSEVWIDLSTHVSARALPSGGRAPRLADVTGPDRDLALRVLNAHKAGDGWWALDLSGITLEGVGGARRHEPSGELVPLLLSSLDEPVAAVWVAPDASARWYIVPHWNDWDSSLSWMVEQALPAFAPGTLRRLRRSELASDPALQTRRETTARGRLAALEAEFADKLASARAEAADAEAAAESLRHLLFYGSGTPLEDAVAEVARAAGLTVVALDAELGGTVSGDLLVGDGVRHVLVEVKAASGRPREDLVTKFERHLSTWSQVAPSTVIDGGVLVVNHERTLPPAERTREVYRRREFVDSLSVRVLSTHDLFDPWRLEDWPAVRRLFGFDVGHDSEVHDVVVRMPEETIRPRRRLWRPRR